MQVAAVEQRLHQHRHAAGIVQVAHDVSAGRLEVGDVRRPAEDLADVVQVEIDPGLVRDRRQVQAAIGRAARGRDHHRGVLERLAGHDVARADALLEQSHHRLARGLGPLVAGLVGRRRAGRARQGEADRLRDAGHGVGGELAAAGAGRGAGDLLERVQLVLGDRADRVLADRLEHVLHGHVPALEPAGQDAAAVHEHRRAR